MTDGLDAAVVGAGPGGYVAAIRAAQRIEAFRRHDAVLLPAKPVSGKDDP